MLKAQGLTSLDVEEKRFLNSAPKHGASRVHVGRKRRKGPPLAKGGERLPSARPAQQQPGFKQGLRRSSRPDGESQAAAGTSFPPAAACPARPPPTCIFFHAGASVTVPPRLRARRVPFPDADASSSQSVPALRRRRRRRRRAAPAAGGSPPFPGRRRPGQARPGRARQVRAAAAGARGGLPPSVRPSVRAAASRCTSGRPGRRLWAGAEGPGGRRRVCVGPTAVRRRT